jgi:hypothetical protein
LQLNQHRSSVAAQSTPQLCCSSVEPRSTWGTARQGFVAALLQLCCIWGSTCRERLSIAIIQPCPQNCWFFFKQHISTRMAE